MWGEWGRVTVKFVISHGKATLVNPQFNFTLQAQATVHHVPFVYIYIPLASIISCEPYHITQRR